MTRTLAKTLVALGFVSTSICAFGQNQDPNPPFPEWDICHDFTSTTPLYTPGSGTNGRATDLFRFTVGSAGQVVYFGSNAPCDPRPAQNYNLAGRIGFASGPIGSIQDDFAGAAIDNDMAYTFGMTNSPAGNWSYATTVRIDPTDATLTKHSTLIGPGISGVNFDGASGRYTHHENTADGINTIMRFDSMGDACRINWQLVNMAGSAQELGIYYGALLGILPEVEGFGPAVTDSSGVFGDANPYTTFPGHKPILVDSRFTRANDPGNFPPFVQFCFGQTRAYGLQVDLGPTPATSDPNGNNSDATDVDELVIGSNPFVIGDYYSTADTNLMPDFVFGDASIGNEQFMIKYEPGTVGAIAANQSRTINSYFHDTWSNARYTQPFPIVGRPSYQPYTTVIDAPHILVQDDGSGTNGLLNNPFPIRVYVDNAGGYSDVYNNVPINDVHIHLNLPAGMSFVGGDTADKTITNVNALDMDHVDYLVQSDGVVIGDLPYSVTISSTPGPTSPITHNGIIRVSATKQIPLVPSANLVSTPWVYTDSSWEAVLAPLTSPADFTVYEWDPVQNSYVISASAKRGQGEWLILNPASHPNPEVDAYNGANEPTDLQSGFNNYQLKSGWNLIGNPYPYAIPVSQFVGVSAANPAQSFSFSSLVDQNVVSPFLAYWDPTVQGYRYVQGIEAIIQPNQGYWIQVLTSADLTLNFPPIFDTFVPGGKAATTPPWVQSANHWRLNIQANSALGHDQENYVGVAVGTQARSLQIPKPPSAPFQDVAVSVDGSIAGMRQRLAQGMSDHAGSLQWTVYSQAAHAGPVTLTWPNLSTLPSNISFRMVDASTHQSVDMRAHPSITYNSATNQLKTFYVQSTSTATLPTIGSVTTTAGRLAARVSATATVSLNYPANVNISIVDAQLHTVAVLMADMNLAKGSRQVSWNLKNASGSYVPAGTYQVIVTAIANGVTDSKSANVIVNR